MMDAVRALHGQGAHLLRCRGKRPAHREPWTRRRRSPDELDGYDVGLIPASLGFTVVDVDDGTDDDLADFLELHPPTFMHATRRGYHLWYRHAHRGGRKWRWRSLSGDVVHDRGYVLLHDADAVAYGSQRTYAGAFPAELVERTVAVASVQSPPRPRDASEVESMVEGDGRNCDLFERVRRWAYRRRRRFADELKFHADVLGEAIRVNRRYGEPMGEREVDAVAASVSRWTWRRKPIGDPRRAGRRGGLASGRVRREKMQARRRRVASMVGRPASEIAAALGVSLRTVRSDLASLPKGATKLSRGGTGGVNGGAGDAPSTPDLAMPDAVGGVGWSWTAWATNWYDLPSGYFDYG